MMFEKARLFQDKKLMEPIRLSSDPDRIKALGRSVADYNETLWNGMRQLIVYQGLMAKFSQNDGLKAKLLQTGDAILAECAIKDPIWGIGLSMSDPSRTSMSCWKGENLLGFSLMMVREQLREC